MTVNGDIKIILLGESGVGKTSLLLRFKSGEFRTNLPRTFVDHKRKTIKVKGKEVNIEVWDTAGQETHRSIIRSYYRMADGVLLVYDVTDVTTFMKLSRWLSDLRSMNESAEVVIAGNKNEDPSKNSVAVSTVKNFARDEQLEYLEVSAKSGDNVETIFNYLAQKILAARGIELSSEKQPVSDHQTESAEILSLLSTVPKESSSRLKSTFTEDVRVPTTTGKLNSSRLEDSPESVLLSAQEQASHMHNGFPTTGSLTSSTAVGTSSNSQFREDLTSGGNSDSILQPIDSSRRISVCSATSVLEFFDYDIVNSCNETENQLSKEQTSLDQKDRFKLDQDSIVILHDEAQTCDELKKKKRSCVIL